MKKYYWILPLCIVVACTVERPVESNISYPAEVTARIEEGPNSDTKVYADEKLKVLWNNDDRISLFNKYTYNKEYRFSGSTGANSGVFKEVSSGEVVVGNELDYVYAVYPYNELTEISNTGIITLDLPSEQAYAENSFGLGANTMVSATTNTELLFKNICGYVVLKLYGDGVSVSSITLRGNNNEVLAGTADVTAAVGSTPSLSFRSTGTSTAITLNCSTPVKLGTTAEDATVFWIVVPPTKFTNGFNITVTDSEGNTFEKSTSSSKDVVRNRPYRMGALEVVLETHQPNNVIYYTSTNSEIVIPNKTDAFGANIISNTYENRQGVLTFDGNITSIGNNAFFCCTSLSSIVIPESVTSIGSFAFNGCESLSAVNIPEGVTSIEGYAFAGTSLASIVIPDGITSISGGVFASCVSLSAINLPEGVTSIGGSAFKNCTSLTSIVIPDGVTSIGSYAFKDCTNLASVNIPEGVTSLWNYVFAGCTSLASIVVPNGVTSIWTYAFAGCTSLASINIPESVTTIGDYAFTGCTSLALVNIPVDVTEISIHAFEDCTSLTSIIIPESVTSIGNNAFAGCTSLVSVSFPENLTSIGNYAFEDCTSLTSIVIPESVTSIGNFAFQGCERLSAINIPKGVTSIEGYAFAGCTNLTSIIIPEGITIIKIGAFYSCTSLSSIIIPKSVTTIGFESFNRCLLLSAIYCQGETPPTGNSQMFDNTNNCPIYVPAEAVETYKAAEYWSNYADRIQAKPEAIDLGLSVKWASCNIGASAPEEFGDEFVWGETEPRTNNFTWETYKWCNGTNKSLTKYNSNSEFGAVDNKSVLDEEDDAAHVLYGGFWRMPTREEANELFTYCEMDVNYEDKIVTFTSTVNGNTIVFPLSPSAYRDFAVWTKSLSRYSYTPDNAAILSTTSFSNDCTETSRVARCNIRAVLAE